MRFQMIRYSASNCACSYDQDISRPAVGEPAALVVL
jgi:hypothetical protein